MMEEIFVQHAFFFICWLTRDIPVSVFCFFFFLFNGYVKLLLMLFSGGREQSFIVLFSIKAASGQKESQTGSILLKLAENNLYFRPGVSN